MNQEILLGIVRHILTTAGGVLVTKGLADSSMIEGGSAAIVTLIGIIWSIIHKGNVQNKINVAALTGNSNQ